MDLIESADEQVDNDGSLRLHGELGSNFQWTRRPVYICLDADRLKNRDVRQTEIGLCFFLRSLGADVFQLSTWPLAEGKGIDDFLAGKAGTDPEKQREILAGLIEKAVPFLETIDHHDIDALKGELHKTQGERAKFDELAKTVARRLGVPKVSLDPFKDDHQKDLCGAEAIEIPLTAKPWDEEVKADEVLDEISDTIGRFVWAKPSQRRAVALWIVLTYLHDAVTILPILLITSPEEECGKTTLLELIYDLSNRPIPASTISAAAIYRAIKDDSPTLILDEADSYFREDETMGGVINSGHKRAFAYVIRIINKRGDVGKFFTWCPKASAMIGLPKKTILSRSIHIRLDRKSEDAKTAKLRDEHYEQFEVLRRKIARLADDIRPRVKTFKSEVLGNRAGDNWQPLFAIAEPAGEEWLKETVLAAQRISRIKSVERYLLESLDCIIQEKRKRENLAPTERIFLRSLDLVNELNRDAEAPWHNDKSGGLTARRLSGELWKYEIKSEKVQRGSNRGWGYWSDRLEKVISQYARNQH